MIEVTLVYNTGFICTKLHVNFCIYYSLLTIKSSVSICHHTVDPFYPFHPFPLPLSCKHYSVLCICVCFSSVWFILWFFYLFVCFLVCFYVSLITVIVVKRTLETDCMGSSPNATTCYQCDLEHTIKPFCFSFY